MSYNLGCYSGLIVAGVEVGVGLKQKLDEVYECADAQEEAE